MNTPTLARLLQRSRQALLDGDVEAAQTHLEAAAALEPEHVTTLHYLGAVAHRIGLADVALPLYEKALAVSRIQQEDLVASIAHLLADLGAGAASSDAVTHGLAAQDAAERVQRLAAEAALAVQDGASVVDETPAHDVAAGAPPPAPVAVRAGGAAERLRVGFVSIWFERGQAYVTKAIRDAVAERHETFVFARTGGVYGEAKLETGGDWHVPNLTTHPSYDIAPDVLAGWVRANGLDVVVFNEEYDWALVRAARAAGAAAVTYLDYYKDDWKPHMDLYDAVLCSTRRSYELARGVSRAHYVGWCVDPERFRARPEAAEYTFFHNAGWLGIGYRKMTPAAILAFDAVSRRLADVRLLVHAQVGLDKLPPGVAALVRSNPRITYHVATVPAPGLYHRGRIFLFPSKLEGLGLPLGEALACGLPALAADAAPMNEFVSHGENGLLVRVGETRTRQDHIAFPEALVDVNDLALKMARLATDDALYERLAAGARRSALERLDPKVFADRIHAALAAAARPAVRREDAVTA